MLAATSQLDTNIEVVTPENIAFEFRVAGPSRRFVAYCIDWVIRSIILSFIVMILFIGRKTILSLLQNCAPIRL